MDIVTSYAVDRVIDFFDNSVVDNMPGITMYPDFIESLLENAFTDGQGIVRQDVDEPMVNRALAFLRTTGILERPAITSYPEFARALLEAAVGEDDLLALAG